MPDPTFREPTAAPPGKPARANDPDDRSRANGGPLAATNPARRPPEPNRVPPTNLPEAFGRTSPPLPDAFGRGNAAPPKPEKEQKRPAHEPPVSDDADPDQDEPARKQNHPQPHPAKADDQNPSDEPTDDEPKNDEPKKPPLYKRPIPMIILSVVLIGLIVGGLLYWLHARHFENTDDAFIAAHVTRIAPRVSGQVRRVLVDDNQLVRAGDLLVEIDPTDLQARLDQEQANLLAAQGKLAEARANVLQQQAALGQAQAAENSAATENERAAADLRRYEALDDRAVSQQQRDQVRAAARTAAANVEAAKKHAAAARAQVESGEAQVRTAQASIQVSQAAVEQARIYLSYTKITAPQDGRVTNRNVEPGSYVQTSQAMFSLVPRDVWVVANFKETQLTDMRPGQPVDVEVDAYPKHTFPAHVDSFQAGSGAAFSLLPPENATGNYVKVVQRVPVKIVFDNPPDDRFLLGPGMSVTPKVRVR